METSSHLFHFKLNLARAFVSQTGCSYILRLKKVVFFCVTIMLYIISLDVIGGLKHIASSWNLLLKDSMHIQNESFMFILALMDSWLYQFLSNPMLL